MNDNPRTYPQGVPSWVEGQVPDTEAASAFYGELFGWTLEERLPPQIPGSYRIASRDGLDVGALASLPEGESPRWLTYVAVDDAEASAAAVVAAGGTAAPPEDAGPGGSAGRSVMAHDPDGIAFALWQARDRLGSQFVNRPGGWVFSDLEAGDPAVALEFYSRVFGWTSEAVGPDSLRLSVPGYGAHLAATSDPGILERQAVMKAPPGFADVIGAAGGVAAGRAPGWGVGFSVASRDDAVATVERLGGAVLGTADLPWSLTADVVDPQGAAFRVNQFVPKGLADSGL